MLKAAKWLPTALQKISNGVGPQPRVFAFYSPVLFFAKPVVFKLCLMKFQKDVAGITVGTAGDTKKVGLSTDMAAPLLFVLYGWGST